ncbi:hypothetical protein SAMN04487972_11556 [Paracoccus halophilus]|uniref:Uncharacterized protein n=1 Tax=Paracoccus halophilus TaxID=376733 RepID=A0A1I0TXW4_9RHOB|nr:hypothetical protein SAMN04487972_11556 [Paracoccus halophilus]
MPNLRPNPSLFLNLQLGLGLTAVGFDLLTQDEVRLIFKEGHSIEVMSYLLLLFAALAWLALGMAKSVRGQWHIPMILTLMALREMDFDKRFTTEGVLQLRLYSGGAPLWEKAIGLAVVLLIVICGLRLMFLNLPLWWRGLREGAVPSWLVGIGAVLLVVSKSLDGLGRKLAPLGIELEQWQGTLAGRLEEILELGMAILLVQAVVYFARSRQADPVASAIGQPEFVRPRPARASALAKVSGTRALSGNLADSTSSAAIQRASSASSPATGRPETYSQSTAARRK